MDRAQAERVAAEAAADRAAAARMPRPAGLETERETMVMVAKAAMREAVQGPAVPQEKKKVKHASAVDENGFTAEVGGAESGADDSDADDSDDANDEFMYYALNASDDD